MGRRRIVDLSISIEPDLPSDPPMMIPKIDFLVAPSYETSQEQSFF